MPKQAQAKSSTPAETDLALANLMRKLNALQTHPITGAADADAVLARVVAIEIKNHLPGRFDHAKAEQTLFDAISDSDDPDYDLIATLARAGCRFPADAVIRAAA